MKVFKFNFNNREFMLVKGELYYPYVIKEVDYFEISRSFYGNHIIIDTCDGLTIKLPNTDSFGGWGDMGYNDYNIISQDTTFDDIKKRYGYIFSDIEKYFNRLCD